METFWLGLETAILVTGRAIRRAYDTALGELGLNVSKAATLRLPSER